MKVYISKSKMGNPDLLMNLRHLLAHQFGQNIEVKEYFGGVYNSNIIDNSNYLIVCPPQLSVTGQHIIGKGQWSEILNAQKKNIPVVIFNGICAFNFLHKLTVVNETDWNAFAKMITGKELTTLITHPTLFDNLDGEL